MYLCICMRLQASIHIKAETHVREHEVLPNESDIFLETLSFRLPHHQNLHLYQIFSLLNVLME